MKAYIKVAINNLPANYKDYQYITARYCNGAWWFYGAWKDSYNNAVEQAEEIDGIMIRSYEVIEA